jgi:tRNA-2-methylthio-N6-dimethylallyladenosine synthase
MHEVLKGAGYHEVGEAREADVIVLNTCSVREKAEQKLRSEVGRLAKLKKSRPEVVIVVAGCVAQQEGERLLKQLRSIDLVVGPDNIPEIPRLLEDLALGAPPLARTVFDTEAPRFLAATGSSGAQPSAYVTIMKGCDERCSFCIVPYTRGPERYRSSDEIVAEIKALAGAGASEVTLLGQTVNSYKDPLGALPKAPGARDDDPDESEFAALLRRIARDVPALARLRYTSPHPRHVTPSLVLAHAEVPLLARHVHLPVQSGSDRVLKRMIRRYSRAEYVKRAAALRGTWPDLTLSTDIIVGFPGETEDDFLATLSLVREVGFTGVFGFKYSQRPYTPALRLPDDVPEEVKSERLARLFALSEELCGAHLVSLVGSRVRVLVEGRDKGSGVLWSGRSERNEIVHVEGAGDVDLAGAIAPVDITRANKHSLEGRLAEEARGMFAPLRAPLATMSHIEPPAPVSLTAPSAPASAGRDAKSGRRSLPLIAAQAQKDG